MTYLVEGIRRLDAGEKKVRRVGEYGTRGEAIRAAEQLIDTFLVFTRQPGMTAAELLSRYEAHGEIPVIFNDTAGMQSLIWFNYNDYAALRCVQMHSSAGEAASV